MYDQSIEYNPEDQLDSPPEVVQEKADFEMI